ncbi:MAG: ribosomal L7Ae/L30e/S12e/Gadd45 family protein [Candidatus Syntrophosphaera sp.]|nr:ribosomal L7Ae/L30e/S12e/Gadd45 family protein [Candidatus Syntrophosphaera sp.]
MNASGDNSARIINLMQFARKAGKLVSGADACIRALHGKGLHLIVIAGDTTARTVKRIENATAESSGRVPTLRISTQQELSAALGLPLTGIFGIQDRQFAARMMEYHTAQQSGGMSANTRT